MNIIFVTGTDTEIGKTFFVCHLIRHLQDIGESVCALKPVASGGDEDALRIQQALASDFPLDMINPIRLSDPIAPHIAGQREGIDLSIDTLNAAIDPIIQACKSDWLIIEGCGGWQVPLNEHETLAQWVVQKGWPVVCVVGMRLGCLNHSFLTIESILASGALCLGWVANECDPNMLAFEDNLETLKSRLPVPCLLEIEFYI